METRIQIPAKTACKPYINPANADLLQSKRSNDQSNEKRKLLTLRRSSFDQAEDDSMPPLVHEVLQSVGEPLDSTTRAYMEPRFGHDFSRVRVHADNKAAESARAVNALAYTVGNHVMFGSGQHIPQSEPGRRLIAHELTHVVQQTEGLQSFIQRKNGEVEGCDGNVDDIFELHATNSGEPPETRFALISRKNEGAAKSKSYHIGDYLNDYMVIVDIPSPLSSFENFFVLIMHCKTLEKLYTRPPEPEHIIKVKCGTFGHGIVKTFNNCQRVEFEPEDGSKPHREYVLDNESGMYWLQDNTRTAYPPSDLEGYLGIYLQGDKCGVLKECQEPKGEGNESQKGHTGTAPATLEDFENPEDIYGDVIQKENTKSDGSIVQYEDGTIEYYNPEKKLQRTFRVYNGVYIPYENNAKISMEIDKSALEDEWGVKIR